MTNEVDKWYSWLVVAVCFVVNFMNIGMNKITGLFFSDIISYYNVDREQASTPFLLGSVTRSISGPVCGYLSYRFGLRFVILLGCILSSVGIFSCSFAKDISALCGFWSIYGLGCGLSTHILPQLINLFNHNHATKANGIAFCGPSIAGIILPFITIVLLNSYGMTGTFLNLSALMLNTIPCVLLLRNQNTKNSKDSHPKKNNSKTNIFSEEKTMTEENRVPSLDFLSNCTPCPSRDGKDHAHCMNNQAEYTRISGKERTIQVEPSLTTIEESKNKSEKDLFLPSCSDPKKNTKSVETENYLTTDKRSFNQTNTIVPNESSIDKVLSDTQPIPIKKEQNCLHVFSILLDPLFILFAIPRCLCASLYIIMPTILVDFSIDKGIAKNQATYVLVAMSAADLFGKACLGWITDGNHMSRIRYTALWYCIIAFAFGLMAWSNGFVVMIIATCLQSVGVATIFSTTCALLSEYFEKEEQSMAIASSEIFLLPFWFGTPPLIGYFRDHLGSYNGLVYILSAVSILCCVLVLLIPNISNWRMKKKENIPHVEK